MQVRALSAGFFGGGRRRAGDVFDVPEGAKATWFAPVSDVKAAEPAKAKGNEPKALSQIGKSQPQSMTQVLAGDKKGGADLV